VESYLMHVNGRSRPWQPASGIAAWRPAAAGLRPPAARWAAWARRIMSRHRPARGHWGWLAAILARPRLTLRATTTAIRWPISLAIPAAPPVSFPRAATRMAPVAAPLPATAPPSPLLRIVARRGDLERRRMTGADVSMGQNLTRTRESALVARLAARRQRHERQETPSPSPAISTGGFRPSLGPLPLPGAVVARTRPATGAESTPTPLRGMAPPLTDQGALSRPALTTIDIQGLADQVIRTIDQRVIAARERLGAP
jgi:hypothetical protein